MLALANYVTRPGVSSPFRTASLSFSFRRRRITMWSYVKLAITENARPVANSAGAPGHHRKGMSSIFARRLSRGEVENKFEFLGTIRCSAETDHDARVQLFPEHRQSSREADQRVE